MTTILSSSSGEANFLDSTTVCAPSVPSEAESSETHLQDHHRCRTQRRLICFDSKNPSVPVENIRTPPHDSPLPQAKQTESSAPKISDWLEVFPSAGSRGSSSDAKPCNATTLQVQRVLLTRWSEENAQHNLDLGQREEIVVCGHADHRGHNAGTDLSVVLAFGQRIPVLMRCSWSTPR